MSHLVLERTESLVGDSDQHFEINATSRKIRPMSAEKKTIMQFDHNSERFTFSMPRYIEEHDMSECTNIEVHFKDKCSNKGIYPVRDLVVDAHDEEKVKFTWLISKHATQSVGVLAFLIRFACIDNDGTVLYDWHTDTFTGISISKSIHNTSDIVEKYVDVLEKWKIELNEAASKLPIIGENGNWYLWNIQSKRYVDSGVFSKGTDGHTPEKGVDYYTDAEKQEIIGEISSTVDGKENKSNKVTTFDNNINNVAYPTTSAVNRELQLKENLSSKVDNLNFSGIMGNGVYPNVNAVNNGLATKEDRINKSTTIWTDSGAGDDNSYPTTSAVVNEVFTPLNGSISDISLELSTKEDKSNKSDTIWNNDGDNAYPTTNAIINDVIYICQEKQDLSEKATSIDNPNHTQYPTTQAVVDFIGKELENYERIENKADIFFGNEDGATQQAWYPSVKGCVDFVNSRDNLRLIRTIILGENSSQIIINTDEHGNSFTLKEAKVLINGTAVNTVDDTPASIFIRCQISSDAQRYDYWGSSNSSALAFRNSYILYLTELGNLNSTCIANLNTNLGYIMGNSQYISCYGTDTNAAGNYQYKATNFVLKSVGSVSSMTYFKFTADTNKVINAGTKIEIWGR